MEKLKKNILEQVKMEQEISPFLFISQNLELLNEKVKKLALDIFFYLDIPKTELHIFDNESDNIKIDELKKFLSKINIKSPYKLQIFIINNFSKTTISASNSVLKILEESGKGNLIFLTSISESGILDTVLSRVKIIKLNNNKLNIGNNFFEDLIKNIIDKKNMDLIKYFFQNKQEKEDYIQFLKSLEKYFIKNFIFIEYLEELQDDIEKIIQNNVLVKNICDKWILRIF